MSSQSSGSTIRLIVLIAVLGIVGFAFYNDTMNRKPQVDKLTEDFFALEDSEEGPFSSEKLQAKMKMKPDRSFKVGKYDVEEYKLRRTIPFLSFGSMYAVYEKNELFKIAQGAEPTVDSIEKANGLGSFEQKEKVLEAAIGGMGLPAPNFKKEEGKEDGKSESKEAPKDEPKEEAKEEKKEEAPAPENKEAEGEKKGGDEQPKEGDGG